MFKNSNFSNNSHRLSRAWFLIVVVLLVFLLLIKITDRQWVFSYQSVHTDRLWFSRFQSGINSINKSISWWTGWSKEINNGIGELQEGLRMIRNSKLLQLWSWSLIKANTLLMLSKTSECYELLIDGYHTIEAVYTWYDLLTSGYTHLKTSLQSTLSILPSSATKSCLQWYWWSLESAYLSLANTNRTINDLKGNYNSLLLSYKGSGWSCLWIEQLVDTLSTLRDRINAINQIIISVQKSLDSKEIAKYNEFCKYDGIVWLSWLQKISRDSFTQAKSLWSPSLQKVDAIKEYIQKLIDTSKTTSGTNSSGWWFSKRWR